MSASIVKQIVSIIGGPEQAKFHINEMLDLCKNHSGWTEVSSNAVNNYVAANLLNLDLEQRYQVADLVLSLIAYGVTHVWIGNNPQEF